MIERFQQFHIDLQDILEVGLGLFQRLRVVENFGESQRTVITNSKIVIADFIIEEGHERLHNRSRQLSESQIFGKHFACMRKNKLVGA